MCWQTSEEKVEAGQMAAAACSGEEEKYHFWKKTRHMTSYLRTHPVIKQSSDSYQEDDDMFPKCKRGENCGLDKKWNKGAVWKEKNLEKNREDEKSQIFHLDAGQWVVCDSQQAELVHKVHAAPLCIGNGSVWLCVDAEAFWEDFYSQKINKQIHTVCSEGTRCTHLHWGTCLTGMHTEEKQGSTPSLFEEQYTELKMCHIWQIYLCKNIKKLG